MLLCETANSCIVHHIGMFLIFGRSIIFNLDVKLLRSDWLSYQVIYCVDRRGVQTRGMIQLIHVNESVTALIRK